MLEFEATLVRLPGKIIWTVFYVPSSFTDTLGTKSHVNVLASVDSAEFRSTLLPSSNGHYLVYNQAMREHCGKKIGATVHVLLEVDNQPREVVLPQDVSAALAGSALEKFTALPYYVRREEINKINAAKTLPTREKRIRSLLDKLLE